MDYIVTGKETEINKEIEERLTKRAAVDEKVEASRAAKAAAELAAIEAGGTATAVEEPAVIADASIPAAPLLGQPRGGFHPPRRCLPLHQQGRGSTAGSGSSRRAS